MEQKCLKCGGILFKKVLLDDKGHTAMDMSTKIDLESDGLDQFYKCPHCQTKNVIADVTRPDSPPQIRISRIKE